MPFSQVTTLYIANLVREKTFPKVRWIQGIKYFDSFNNFSSKQNLQQALKSQSNFSLVLFGKRQEIHKTAIEKSNNLNKIQQEGFFDSGTKQDNDRTWAGVSKSL